MKIIVLHIITYILFLILIYIIYKTQGERHEKR
jgi:hypothetical protein